MKLGHRIPSKIVPMVFYNGTPCIPWAGYITTRGYGGLTINGKTTLAHRAVYENVIGPIPPGLVIDHLCRNRSCVNPEHMEPATNKENVLRGAGITADNARKVACVRDHKYTDGSYRMYRGGRICRACCLIDGPKFRALYKARKLVDRLLATKAQGERT